MNTEFVSAKDEKSSFNLYRAVAHNHLNYVYRGQITEQITRNLLMLAQNNMLNNDDERALNKRVYHILVESLQNISKHQAKHDTNSQISNVFFALKKENQKFYVATGNLIENKQLKALVDKIEIVNSMNSIQLKEYHKQKLKNGSLSDKGGAGLGLIDIARRSGSKLGYDYKQLNSNQSYFYILTEIGTEIPKDELAEHSSASNYHVLNSLLDREDVVMLFNNKINQESLLDLLSFIEKQMANANRLKKQMYNIMIELFQNMIKHGLMHSSTEDENNGFFYISEDLNYYYIATGNYITANKVRSLKGKLNYINNLEKGDLEIFYGKRLFDSDFNTNRSAGLGFIDLRIKSGHILNYDIRKISENKYFFNLKIKIIKQ